MSSREFLHDSEVDDFSDVDSEVDEELTWIEWYCSIKGNEFFVEVDEDYIRDDFNLTGLSLTVRPYDRALDTILDEASVNEYEGQESLDSEDFPAAVMQAAQTLYGLIHARFILTNRGMSAMAEKYKNSVYGTCPNVYCNNRSVLPIGMSDILGQSRANVFCPLCNVRLNRVFPDEYPYESYFQEMYYPRSSRLASLDGAYFGTTFAHMFFFQPENTIPPPLPTSYYIPKIYGFCIWRGVKDVLRLEDESRSQGVKRRTNCMLQVE